MVPTFIEILKLLHYTYFCVIRLREIGMPADYVHKLTRMFQDIKISEDLNQQFKKQDRKTKGDIAGNKLGTVLLGKFIQQIEITSQIPST